jgi:hypothetical protein
LTTDGLLTVSVERRDGGMALTIEADGKTAAADAEVRLPGCRPRTVKHYNQTNFLEELDA